MRKQRVGMIFAMLVGACLFGAFFAGRLTRAGAGVVEASAARPKAKDFAVTPGWECVPTAAGQPVISGGTGAVPSCGLGTTAVLAPTFVSSGVGGKPTVVFSSANVQIVSGSGATDGVVNGEGNLVVGYAENPSGHSQTGSNNLIVGSGNGWTSFGGIVGGSSNQASGAYATVVGNSNRASGGSSFVAGHRNQARGLYSSVLGGTGNDATTKCGSIPNAPGVC